MAYKQYRAGAWRIEVDAGRNPITKRREKIRETVHAPNNKIGARAADDRIRDIIVEVNAKRLLPSSGLTIREFLVRYIETRRPAWEKKSPGQPDATLQRLENHVFPLVGDQPFDSFNQLGITALYNTWRAGRPPSARCTCRASRTSGCAGHKAQSEASIRRLHNTLHAAWEWAILMEAFGIARNPFDKVEKPEPPAPKPKAPTSRTVARMIAMASLELKVFLRLKAITGARRGQMCGLRWDRVDLDGQLSPDGVPSILWNSSLAKVTGGVAEKATKTENEWRTALDADSVTMLIALHRQSRERALAVGVSLPADAFVFARDVAGKVPWHPDGAGQRFNRLKAAYIEKYPDDTAAAGVTLKQLRNYMATEMLGAGEDPTVLKERGGWSNTNTPLKHYAAFRPARDQAAAERLAAGLDGAG